MRDIGQLVFYLLLATLIGFAGGFGAFFLGPAAEEFLEPQAFKTAAGGYAFVVALAASRLPGARPSWAHSVALLALLATMYGAWPLLNIRDFGRAEMYERDPLLLFAAVAVVGGLALRAAVSLVRGNLAVLPFVLLAALALHSLRAETYVHPGAVGWVKLNSFRYQPIIDKVSSGEDPCADDTRIRCVVGAEGRVLFIRQTHEEELTLGWYGFAFDPTGKLDDFEGNGIYQFADKVSGSADVIEPIRFLWPLRSVEPLGSNWYLVYGDAPNGLVS
jgi:hypothetical protein